MTVMETDGIDMAGESDESLELTLDRMFEWLEELPVPEGFKAEIVGGNVFMSPQRDTHWEIIRRIVRALQDRFGMDVRVLSDVRIDFPGQLNGFAPDVVKLSANANKADGRWRYEDVEFIAEVIAKTTATNDYGPKKAAYAIADVPVYLIVDPYTGRCRVFSEPKNGEYTVDRTVAFGEEIDLTGTEAGLTIKTDEFPRG
ncbi:hypothetical protein QR77_15885 [Streptomyces sp. 150FB]|uniref:Uma2 family endonuclease n=1 Tax=Streptomyces sp. 150FB TaxID=1576605 RepID=UPI000589147A|nr:Uma2 family endonuclease [Streptomyces sp. 150FB]KIF75021.1 hypothetical protein QR77_15885 [Streptomyces sp. 150FB]